MSRWGSGYWKVSVSGYQEAVSVWRYKSGMAYESGMVCRWGKVCGLGWACASAVEYLLGEVSALQWASEHELVSPSAPALCNRAPDADFPINSIQLFHIYYNTSHFVDNSWQEHIVVQRPVSNFLM